MQQLCMYNCIIVMFSSAERAASYLPLLGSNEGIYLRSYSYVAMLYH